MQTVTRSRKATRIEVPARYQPLICSKIRELFRSIDSPTPNGNTLFLDWLEQERQAGRWILESPYARALDDEAYQELVDEMVMNTKISFMMGSGLITDEISYNPTPIVTDRAVAVRCPVRDCPGHAGWVIEFSVGDPALSLILNESPYHPPPAFSFPPSQRQEVYFVSPRGWVEDEHESGVFAPSQRHAKQARRGYADTAGRRRNRLPFDALAAPLQASDMPTEEYNLAWGPCLVRCPSCQAPRYLQVSAEHATAHIGKMRCGMLRSK